MKKQVIHFSWRPGFLSVTACGAEQQRSVKITNDRNKVTCKRCKATKRFRKIK